MSDFHIVLIVLIFNKYYTQIIAVFDETDAEQKQKQKQCCKPTVCNPFASVSVSVSASLNSTAYYN